VVVGTDGYLFIADGANRWEQQYGSNETPPATWCDGWARAIESCNAQAAARGVTLLQVVVPEKQVIYPEKRWPAGAPSGEGRPVKHLLARLGASYRIIYPQADLTAAKAQIPAYYRHNSHWTASGCAAVVDRLLRELGSAAGLADLPLAIERRREPQDLTIHLFDPPPVEEAAVARPAGAVLEDNRNFDEKGRRTDTRRRVVNAAAPDPRSVAIFGDSYAYDAGLSAMLSSAFREITFVWSKDVRWAVVDERAADIVIWESAERFLNTTPAA
jgi:hypothetical protein